MAGFTEGGNDGQLNGATEVTLVAAPGAGVRRIVRTLTVVNRDTAAVDLTVRVKNGANTRTIARITALPPNWKWQTDEGERYVLDSTTKSITAILGGAVTTTQPDFSAAWGDAS